MEGFFAQRSTKAVLTYFPTNSLAYFVPSARSIQVSFHLIIPVLSTDQSPTSLGGLANSLWTSLALVAGSACSFLKFSHSRSGTVQHSSSTIHTCPWVSQFIWNLSYSPVFTGDSRWSSAEWDEGGEAPTERTKDIKLKGRSHLGRSKCRNQGVTKSGWVDLNRNQRREIYQDHVLLRTLGSRKLAPSRLSENSNLQCQLSITGNLKPGMCLHFRSNWTQGSRPFE